MTRKIRIIAAAALIMAALHFASQQTAAAEPTPEAAQCTAIAHADFSTVLDAPTQVLDARFVAAKDGLPAFCQVDGYVSPQVGFRLQLPTENWNGKFIQIGCGGFCGRDLERYDADGLEKFTPVMSCTPALRKNYACIRTDMGHRGDITQALWASNNLEAQIDHGFRATHVTTLAGKAITERFYKKAPAKSYFMGCSGGGLQALSEAQRFPWDYDGIIAGAAPIHGLIERSLAADVWAYNAMEDSAGKPILDAKAIELLHSKVIAACDENDGVKDGLIGDPRACNFDPATLVCSSGTTTECLTPVQVETVKKIYRGPTAPGAEEFAGQLVGSELIWRSKVVNGVGFAAQGVEGLKYLLLDTPPGPTWTIKDFDFARDYKRFGISHAIHAADNPDLRKFKAAGGKLLMYVGWADRSRPLVNIDYYETVARVMGGKSNTEDFMRLFVIPGMGHCFGGEGPDTVDYLSALENWVEQGQAPQSLIAAKVKPSADKSDFSYWVKAFPRDPKDIVFSRPVYPYPLQTKYKGAGDPTKAENFEPVEPK